MQLQRENGKFYVSMVKNEDPSLITALTVCDDLQALEDPMTAFIRVGIYPQSVQSRSSVWRGIRQSLSRETRFQ